MYHNKQEAEELVEYMMDDPSRVRDNLPEIEDALNSDNEVVRETVMEGLSWIAKDHSSQIIPVLDSLKPSLKDSSPEVRAETASVMSEVAWSNPEEVYSALENLQDLLSSENPDCRAKALKTLYRSSEKYIDAVSELIAVFNRYTEVDSLDFSVRRSDGGM